jgi:hypothetical protein
MTMPRDVVELSNHDHERGVLPFGQSYDYAGPLGDVKPRKAPMSVAGIRALDAELTDRRVIARPHRPWEHFTGAEIAIATWLRSREPAFHVLSVHTLDDFGRTPDAIARDFGVTIEMKSTRPSASTSTIINELRAARYQSERLVLDARGALTITGAELVLDGVLRRVGANLQEIVILTNSDALGWRNA